MTAKKSVFNRTELNMTSGSPTRLLLQFATPLLIGNLFQQMYNMVDSIVVGNVMGANALASVGACSSVIWLFFSIANGLASGIGIIVAQYYGAGERNKVRATIANAAYILVSISLFVGAAGILLAPTVLRLLGTPDTVLGDAVAYFRTVCVGMLFVATSEGVGSSMRALGNSVTPLYFQILACVMNTVLDVLFVKYLHMGVFGAALATVMSQFTAAACVLTYARVRIPTYYRFSKEEGKPDRRIIGNAFRIGLPIAVQSSMIAVSCVVLQNVVNSFGATVMATFTITSRIETLVQQPFQSLTVSLSNYTGQNIGAGKTDRVKQGFRKAVIMASAFSFVMLPLAFFFGRYLIYAFVKDEQVISMGTQALRITSLCYFPLGLIYMPRGVMNGAGDARFSMINGVTEVICRVLYSMIFTRIAAIGYWGIWITTGATWCTVAVICLLRYRSGVWMKKGIVQRERVSAQQTAA
ncbi:MAG: MATE family efflux transporter [Lachnospiraceae bacterium]|jgi:putative MATE family efflux protein|nr:MATE family efflux transporter [Lachnospiraceae bacterium]